MGAKSHQFEIETARRIPLIGNGTLGTKTPAIEDADQDGVADGLDAEKYNPYNDTDGDGAFNIFEKRMGTDPNDPASIPSQPCVGLGQNVYRTGEPLSVYFFTPSPNKEDWIRVFEKSESDNRVYNRRWTHLTGKKCGHLTLEGVNECGDYEIRLFEKGHYDAIARAEFSAEDYKSFPYSPPSGQIRIVTWNIYYFNTDSTTLKKRTDSQLNELARRMVEFEAAVIAVQEINESSLDDLVARMRRIGGNWKAVAWDGIDQAFIVDEDQVSIVSSRTLADTKACVEKSGTPIAYPQLSLGAYVPVELVFKAKGPAGMEHKVTLVNVHLLYACEEERLKQAKWLSFYLHDWMLGHPDTDGIIVAGDFNGAPWSQTGKNMRYKEGIHYVPRINGNASYYDHVYADANGLNHIPAKSSFVITPSQYGDDATSFFKTKLEDGWHMTCSDHYPVFIDYQPGSRPDAQDETTRQIERSFDQYIEFCKSELVRRLAKDRNGNSDTYVLYDIQTHLQNAVIYADERGNREMLRKLLELCLIPFEDRHMTDGKWLNNSYNLVGVEVDLCIAQYFSLLTRVLSACQRHGIDVTFTDEQMQIVTRHIDKWLKQPVDRSRVDDRHLFFVQSALQFADFASRIEKPIDNLEAWKQYAQDYMSLSIEPKWEKVRQQHNGREYECWMLDRTGWADYPDYRHAGYGSEINRHASDTDPNAMFRADGSVKQPAKKLDKLGTDISHGRRFNWFFECVKRFGKRFEISIGDDALQGWANNLALCVCRGTLDDPHFTVFSDGTDGWYRVGYRGRRNFGYTLGDMDIHFVASSYGMFSTYNPRIGKWMRAWATKHEATMDRYHGGYRLDCLSSLEIDIRNILKGMK